MLEFLVADKMLLILLLGASIHKWEIAPWENAIIIIIIIGIIITEILSSIHTGRVLMDLWRG